MSTAQGLSPRTRGNPRGGSGVAPSLGSIPANAGEPRGRSWRMRSRGVYPRERGGTPPHRPHPKSPSGLSPRTRGNPQTLRDEQSRGGSIPANAGEPGPRTPRAALCRVYPRERGGTLRCHGPARSPGGLSPRTRGNPQRDRPVRALPGSIPANAGEPVRDGRSGRRRTVYPRERGGTRKLSATPTMGTGLSPRTRGNRPARRSPCGGCGSIPANAGEPV